MRMRKLGKGQSVVFCVPQEVQRKIREFEAQRVATTSRSRTSDIATEIGIHEILAWAIGETIVDLQKSISLWAAQGKRFDRQETYWNETTTDQGIQMTSVQASRFLEDEAASIEHRYRPQPKSIGAADSSTCGSQRLRDIKKRCSEVGTPDVDESTLQEEQERELAPEVEEEREMERPSPATHAKHLLHPHLKEFVSHGAIPQNSPAVMPAFQALKETSAAEYIDIDLFPKDILVTADFANTIQRNVTGRFPSDAYQRPVQWILSSQPRDWKTVVIISPYEAHELLPKIRASKRVTLHLYCARPNQETRPLDCLDLYPVPSSPDEWSEPFPLQLKIQLNLFAGQLYLNSLDEYAGLCRMLRLSAEATPEGTEVDPDGFIRSSTSETISDVIKTSSFTTSPVNFLRIFLSKSRRDCRPMNQTHLGKILNGALLQAQDFDVEEDAGDRMDISEWVVMKSSVPKLRRAISFFFPSDFLPKVI